MWTKQILFGSGGNRQDESNPLITRPRRFGKTLAMSTVEKFFRCSMQGVKICLKDLGYGKKKSTKDCRNLSGYQSVFCQCKRKGLSNDHSKRICQIIADLYNNDRFLLEGNYCPQKKKVFSNNF